MSTAVLLPHCTFFEVRARSYNERQEMTLTRTFAVVLEPEQDGAFTVRVPALPDIVTYGENERDALAMAEDAIRVALEDRAARGEALLSADPPRIRAVTLTLAA